MKTISPVPSQLVLFLSSELRRHDDPVIATAAVVLLNHCAQASVVASAEGVFVVLWMDCQWTYRALSAEGMLRALAETAAAYTEHIMGLAGAPWIVVGWDSQRKGAA